MSRNPIRGGPEDEETSTGFLQWKHINVPMLRQKIPWPLSSVYSEEELTA